MVNIYSQKEVETLRECGRILSRALAETVGAVKAGVSTQELDRIAEASIRRAGGVPAFLGYFERGMRPYPASLCTSINDEVVHCVPSPDRYLREGDVIGLDLGASYGGLITDMAVTVGVGAISPRARQLLEATRESLSAGISAIRPGATLGDVGHAIQTVAGERGFGLIRDLVGHGVGHSVHEDPKVPNYGTPGQGMRLEKGMVLAIEPMLTTGTWKIRMLVDGWGIATGDGSLSAHFEHTIAVTGKGSVVLTEP